MARPQQPELARDERGRQIPQTWKTKQEAEGTPEEEGPAGPVPEENRPGHAPDHDQDKPEGPQGQRPAP